MKKIIVKALFILTLAVISHGVKAQFDPDGSGNPDGDPDLIPLDPGSWVLVAAGVGYGVKKWRDSKRNNLADSDSLPGDNTTDKNIN